MTLAIIGLLSALVPLLVYLVRRRQSPTLEERAVDTSNAHEDLFQKIVEARRRGDHASADALLRRMRKQDEAEHQLERERKLDLRNAASGNVDRDGGSTPGGAAPGGAGE